MKEGALDRISGKFSRLARSNLSKAACQSPKSFYDARYDAGYMQGFDDDVYEACRVRTIRRVLSDLRTRGFSPRSILDYGCGEGRYIGELQKVFGDSKITGCDISDTGLGIAAERYPAASFLPMQNERIDAPDSKFDFVITVEVLEHVQDIRLAINEIGRALKPGGTVLVTTPCANRYSAEWLMMSLTGGFEPTPDGFGRFRSDEPGHLRRPTDKHIRDLFGEAGVEIQKIYHRGHVVTPFVASRVGRTLLPHKLGTELAMLDWHLFRHFPNGSTLLAVGKKAGAA